MSTQPKAKRSFSILKFKRSTNSSSSSELCSAMPSAYRSPSLDKKSSTLSIASGLKFDPNAMNIVEEKDRSKLLENDPKSQIPPPKIIHGFTPLHPAPRTGVAFHPHSTPRQDIIITNESE